jgi:cytochrome c-type biogenesis protein CcmH
VSLRLAGAIALAFGGLFLQSDGALGQEEGSSDIVVPVEGAVEVPTPSEDPELEATVTELARQLRCPTCQAHSIEDSPAGISQQMKEVIRDRLREGMSPEEVLDHFVAAYGEWILLSPAPTGFNLLVYYLPFIALLAGFGVVALGIRKWMKATSIRAGDDQTFPPS